MNVPLGLGAGPCIVRRMVPQSVDAEGGPLIARYVVPRTIYRGEPHPGHWPLCVVSSRLSALGSRRLSMTHANRSSRPLRVSLSPVGGRWLGQAGLFRVS